MKHWFKTVQQGISQVRQYWQLVGWWYLLVAGWSLLVAYPVHHLLVNQIGHTLSAGALIQGFDYTLWNDFKNAYGSSITPIMDQSILILALAGLSLIFATGGTLATLIHQPTRYNSGLFWGKSAAFFWRLMRLVMVYLLLHGVVLVLFLTLYYIASNGWAPFTLENEGILVVNFRWLAPLYGLTVFVLFTWQDLAKLILVRDNRNSSLSAWWQGLKLLVKHPLRFGSWMLLYGGLWTVTLFLSTWVRYLFASGDSVGLILIFLLISQVFIFLRLTLKIIHLSVLNKLLLIPQTVAPSDLSVTP